MSNAIADFVDSGCSSADPSAAIMADSNGKIAASSSIHSTLASPDENNAIKSVDFESKNVHRAPREVLKFPTILSVY